MVDDADAVPPARIRHAVDQLDQLERLAVDRDRATMLESQRDRLRLVGGALGRGDQLKRVLGGRRIEVLDRAALR